MWRLIRMFPYYNGWMRILMRRILFPCNQKRK
jgi:hypothetical protein